MKKLKIKHIREFGKMKTYDIYVPLTNTFMLKNNVLSHNSEVKNLIDGQQEIL